MSYPRPASASPDWLQYGFSADFTFSCNLPALIARSREAVSAGGASTDAPGLAPTDFYDLYIVDGGTRLHQRKRAVCLACYVRRWCLSA